MPPAFCLLVTLFIGGSEGFITWIAPRLPLEGTPAPPGAPWPMPSSYVVTENQWTVDPASFQWRSEVTGSCDVIDAAIRRYSGVARLDREARPDEDLERIEALLIRVDEPDCGPLEWPHEGMNESYTLTVGGPNAELSSVTVWGALRGMETFSQLIFLSEDKKTRVNSTQIVDSPRFSYRGVHLDTARHFIPVPIILKHLDAMSYNKFNVFHWHVVDDQSFPYPLKIFANMSLLGSYSDKLRYSQDDVQKILQHARLRGIRVIPEFDTPGHTFSWGKALPDLLTPCWGDGPDGGPYRPRYGLEGHAAMEVLNPMENYTYDVLRDVWTEIITDFPDKYVHLGLDEVWPWCWQSNPNISAWMLDNALANHSHVEEYFAERLLRSLDHLGAKFVVWEDPITTNDAAIAKETLVQLWKDTRSSEGSIWQVNARKVAEKGHRMILSSPWYMNVINYGEDWREYYQADPHNFTDKEEDQKLMLGGEACLWVEYVDATNLLSRFWPRASAVAERLWSPMAVNDIDEAQYRLDQQRCRMIRRGIPAAPLMNGFCGDYEWGLDGPAGAASKTASRSADLRLLLSIGLLALAVFHTS